jgi:hypothetical protein
MAHLTPDADNAAKTLAKVGLHVKELSRLYPSPHAVSSKIYLLTISRANLRQHFFIRELPYWQGVLVLLQHHMDSLCTTA